VSNVGLEKWPAMSEDRFRLDHIQIAMPAGAEEAARRFYVGVLGFEEIPKPAELAPRGGAWFRSGSTNVHLGVDPDFVPARKAHPALRCSQYDTLLERLADHDIPVVPDSLPFEGRRHCYIADPFGNRIEIIDSSHS
jgi:catechol 2,3-dioxygenase-like lactoylglutathione lyase family enzyme